MKQELKVLFVEDSEDDLLLELQVLRNAGYQVDYERIQTASAMERQLREKEWDIILCDYAMPAFDAPSAIEVLRKSRKNIPLIIVSGTVGEDVAVEALKLGAADYLLKQNLARLVPAVERSLREIDILRQQTAAENQIHEQAALLDKAQDAIFVTDLDGKILYWNKGAERIYHWAAGEASGRFIHEFLIARAEQLQEAKDWTLAKGDWSGELVDRTKEGSQIVVESRWTLLRDERGHPRSILIINTDITEKKSLQDQIVRTQRLESIGTLTSGIAHDFNNLLTVINVNTEMGLLSSESDEEARDIFQAIHDAGRRAASLTSQLLAFSRKSVMEPVELDLNKILEDLEKMLRRLIGEDLRLKVDAEAGLPSVRSDPTHIEQIIMNLVVNARDAMPEGGRITLRTESRIIESPQAPRSSTLPPGRYVVLSVSDTGCGIPDSIKDRIFEPFFTTKEAGKGTGLGLSTVYGIVKQNGGHILVDSRIDQGTTFQIFLPALENTAVSSRSSQNHIPLPRGTETIFVVEDDPSVRRLTKLVLESLGYTVLEAPGVENALHELASESSRVDLLITDVIMPGMNGCELAKIARNQHPQLAVLFISGYTSHTILEEQILKPGMPFLQKPFSTQSLARKVREALAPNKSDLPAQRDLSK